MAYVYQHIRLDKNEPFYIGIGSDCEYYRAHKFSERNEIWNRIKSKTDIKVEIVYDNIDWGSACEFEKQLILTYGRINNKTGILSNMTDGGEGTLNKVINEETRFLLGTGNRGKKRSEESNLKQSISTTGKKKSPEHCEKIRKYRLGKKFSEESRKKLSESRKGIVSWNKGLKFSEQVKNKMRESKKDKYNGGKNPNAKLVLDIYSGIYYETLKEAAFATCMNYSYFKTKIKKDNNNLKYKIV